MGGWGRDGLELRRRPAVFKYEANERGPDQFHGAFGPLTVSEGRSRHRLVDAFLAAANEAGLMENSDFQWSSAGGRRTLPAYTTQRLAMQRSPRLPPSRLAAPNLTIISAFRAFHLRAF
jgi:choline dehydrogenase